MKDLALSKVYQLLEPGPVVLLTTAHKGRANVMTNSWHMMVEFQPPLIACVVSNANFSFAALRVTKECVIAIPALELASKVVCRSFPASCYSEIVSHLSNSSDYCDAFWAESALELRTTPKALKSDILHGFLLCFEHFLATFPSISEAFYGAFKNTSNT